MKITICTGPILPVPAIRGGAVQRFWQGLSAEFAGHGHEVTVFARSQEGQPASETIDGVQHVRWGGYEQSTNVHRDLLRCLVYAIRAAPRMPAGDIVVTNDFWMPVVLPWLRPRIGCVVASVQRFPKGQFGLYRGCAAIVPVSESVADEIRRQTSAVAPKVEVVPNCVDAAFLSTEPVERQPRHVTRLLFAGRLHPEKGLGLLIDALRKLHEALPGGWEARMMGPSAEADGGGGSRFLEELGRKSASLPVSFEPPVYATDALVHSYDAADIFVYPSLAESGEAFGLAPLEAMARGTVPIVSDLSVFRAYLKSGSNGLVFDHRKTDAAGRLADALRLLICGAAERNRMAVAARVTAEGFSPEVVAGQYLELFHRLVRNPKP